MAPTKIFLTGATGYIGGSILTSLLKQPEKYSISALIRDPKRKDALEKLGVTPIVGSLDDSEILFEAAKNADAVINAADCFHLPATQALVRGLKAKNSKKAVLLHTSGTGILAIDPPSDVPFDDEDIARIHSMPLHTPHRVVDDWIYNNVDDITAAIIYPPTVHGIGTGPFKKIGMVKVNSGISSQRRQGGYFGNNPKVSWDNVNILDLVDLYNLVLEGLLEGKIDQGKEGGCYFATNHTFTWYDFSKKVASVLYRLGKVDSEEISSFGVNDPPSTFELLLSRDSRGVSNRSRRIGWNPTRPSALDTVEEEVNFLIENGEL